MEPVPWIIVPVRSLTDGKRRLAPALAPEQRAALVRRLFTQTLATTLACEHPVLVVSPDPEALELARNEGAHALAEPDPIGLNHALELAGDEAARHGAGALLVIAADLPNLTIGDVRAMLPPPEEPQTPAIVRLAPDADGGGTNALYVRPPGLFPFAYGEGSRTRHLEQANARGARVELVERPGLGFDLDTPGDLERHATLEEVQWETP